MWFEEESVTGFASANFWRTLVFAACALLALPFLPMVLMRCFADAIAELIDSALRRRGVASS
jgi:hypothetical protein